MYRPPTVHEFAFFTSVMVAPLKMSGLLERSSFTPVIDHRRPKATLVAVGAGAVAAALSAGKAAAKGDGKGDDNGEDDGEGVVDVADEGGDASEDTAADRGGVCSGDAVARMAGGESAAPDEDDGDGGDDDSGTVDVVAVDGGRRFTSVCHMHKRGARD